MFKSVLCAILVAVPSFVSAASISITADDRAQVISRITHHLETDYVDQNTGLSAATALNNEYASGAFSALSNGEAFAKSISSRLQSLTGDGHLNVEFSAKPINENKIAEESFSAEQMERWYGAHLNFGVEKIERLPGNVGYLDLRVFPPVDMGGDTFTAAMNVIANFDALVIDLRENGGGIGDMADLVASYLFDTERQPLTGVYDRPSDTLTQRFTQPYVPGARFGAAKPVYVLISSKTFSAAEALAYNLQALQRATIVGETSGGGAHPFEYLPIHPHFVLWSVTTKSVHPITGGNWQSVGVQPDIETKPGQALTRALNHLEARSASDEN